MDYTCLAEQRERDTGNVTPIKCECGWPRFPCRKAFPDQWLARKDAMQASDKEEKDANGR